MLKFAFPAALALAALPAAAAPDSTRLGETIRQAIEEAGPMITEDERATIRRLCGYGGEWGGKSIHFQSGVLVCPNGRRVDDPAARRVADAVGARARTRVAAVMERADVRAAISGEAAARARAAVEAIDVEAIRARALAAADRASMVRIDGERIRRQVERDVERSLRGRD